ncbi:Membrane metallo-endopeptidase-like 1 [Bagarius yarrelli]|uniref:Membrane metallo-endopeptidase-like 1 n=1 Tax=Bagarius yarrelli TaxID=175774 RepID=A0A556V4I4_BAGYA|nr:Membrane metallo-endopeptidase-like 1 [Bagarius yarrelli]
METHSGQEGLQSGEIFSSDSSDADMRFTHEKSSAFTLRMMSFWFLPPPSRGNFPPIAAPPGRVYEAQTDESGALEEEHTVPLVSSRLHAASFLHTPALGENLEGVLEKLKGVQRGSTPLPPPKHRGLEYSTNPSATMCTTPDCVTAAARLLQNMDQTMDPCQNFYRYACGGWLERHVIPETSSLHSVFNILRDELEIVLKGQCPVGVLETPNQQDRQAFSKAKVLYRSCMNESVIEQRDTQPLIKLIDSVGDWPVASEDWNNTADESWSLEHMLASLNSHYNKKVLLEMFVWPDDRDSSRHIIHIDQPSLGMPSRDYYLNDGNYKKVRESYLQFMVSMVKIVREDRNLTQDNEHVWEEIMRVMELERDIANATSPAEERNDITVLYNKMTLRDVQETFNLSTITVQPDEPVVIYCSPYLEKLDNVLSRHSRRTVQNYLVWMLIMERVSSLSRRLKDVRAHYRKVLHGTTVEEARWRDCVRYVQNNMENAVGALYVRETFAGDSKRMVGDLIRRIQESYVETLEELNWMDDESKAKAREKALAISEQIGYPDYILEEDNGKLDQEYIHLKFSEEHYFENVLENLHATAQKAHKKLREPVDPDLWIIGAAVVNAFYSHNRNQIGRNFDKDGNMYNWWSNFSAEHFEEQSKCMVQQYSKFSWKIAGGQNVSGITTLGENIADNGGVRQAYKAYMKWVDREGEEPRLPGLDLNHKQLFFLNFAQVWCGACRPEYAIQSIRTDPHSPLEYRVLGSLQNFEAFSEAFQCQKGSPMNPEDKCRVW